MTRLFVPAMLLAGPLAGLATSVAAQDTTHAVDQGVRVGFDYAPGTQPGLVVLPASGLDSARAIATIAIASRSYRSEARAGADAAGPRAAASATGSTRPWARSSGWS
jgi:hypothetical protein